MRGPFIKLLIVGNWSCASVWKIHVGAEKPRVAKKLAEIKEEQGIMAEVTELILV